MLKTNLKILVPTNAPSTAEEGRYSFEREALAGIDVEFIECPAEEQSFIACARGADALYVRGSRVTRDMIEALVSCSAIILGSSGYDNVDLGAATERGIPVINCPDTFVEEVADHTMMLLLATHRRALEQDGSVRSGHWSDGRKALLDIPRLRGQVLGIIGLGRVGRAVAARAQAFGLQVAAHDPYLHEDVVISAGALPVALEELLGMSDFVSLHVPETAETCGMLNEERIRTMKTNAILLNTSRGGVVVEKSLSKALRRRWIAGAGLDVFEAEPLSLRSELLSAPNTILSPHNASASSRFEPARKRRVGRELALVFRGNWPLSCVNPEVLPRTGLRQQR